MSEQTDPNVAQQTIELSRQSQILHALLGELRAAVNEVAVGDYRYQQLVMEDFPVAGVKRALVYRTGSGYDSLAVPTAGVLACVANGSRLGGTIVNSGTNAVILYLCGAGAATPGAPAIYLAGNGGAWDFRLGNVVWCGHVTAVAQTGASTITVAEV